MLSRAKAARFLLDNFRIGGDEGSPGAKPSRHRTPDGIAFDSYEPSGSPSHTFIAVPGLTVNGERDRRLIRFSRALARAGVRVAALELPGLKSCTFDPTDVAVVGNAVRALRGMYRTPVGIIAFSYGAGIALTAASAESTGEVGPVVAFGAYHNLGDAIAFLEARYRQEPRPGADGDWDNFLYLRSTMAWAVRGQIGLPAQDVVTLKVLLEHWCENPAIPPRRALYERALKPREREIEAACRAAHSPAVLAAMSPAGKIRAAACRVLLLHDISDTLIPPEHSRRLYSELELARGPGRQRLLVTPLLSHVNAGSLKNLRDIPALLSLIAELFKCPR